MSPIMNKEDVITASHDSDLLDVDNIETHINSTNDSPNSQHSPLFDEPTEHNHLNVGEEIVVLNSCESDENSTSSEHIDSISTVSIIGENQQTPQSLKHEASQRNNKTNDEPIPLSTHMGRITPQTIAICEASVEIWLNMVYKEEATLKLRNAKVFSDRTSYLPRMRAILLDWIMEVCEVYHLRRSTYYLAVDYIDRYLTIKPGVPKTQLQLLGVSCLFIAAKLEEIYPPKLSEFSYVCDGACTEQEILACEALLLGDLSWDVNPMTPTSWLNLYMQIYCTAESNLCPHLDLAYDFQFPQYSGYNFVQASHLIDLFSMDPGFLRFSYSIIAAAAMYYVFGRESATSVSGYAWNQLESCIEYMSVFRKLLNDLPDIRVSTVPALDNNERNTEVFRAMRIHVPNIIYDETHCMQTHVIDLDCFERATLLRLEEMGMRVEKTFAKRKKRIEKPPTPPPPPTPPQVENTSDKQNGQQHVEETTVVIYEIEKILNEAVEHVGDILVNDNKSAENGVGVNILKIDKKTKLSFDDILSSIHNDYYENKYNKC